MSNNITRLSASNASEENILKMAYEHLGHLGAYEDKEFTRLKIVVEENSDFTLDWVPSNMDPRAGRAKLRPKPNNVQAVRILDRARAYKLMERHRFLKKFHAIGIIRAIKKNRFAMRAKVQDFMIRHAYDEELFEQMTDLENFKSHVRKNVRDDFSNAELEAIFEYQVNVREVLERVPGPRPESKKDLDNDSADPSEGGDEQQTQSLVNEPDSAEDTEQEQQISEEHQGDVLAGNEDVLVATSEDVLADQRKQPGYEEL